MGGGLDGLDGTAIKNNFFCGFSMEGPVPKEGGGAKNYFYVYLKPPGK